MLPPGSGEGACVLAAFAMRYALFFAQKALTVIGS